MAATNATFKLGIQFENWKNLNEKYIHSFGFLKPDCWACGFHHFWLKGMQQGHASQIGDYVAEHLGAREGRFAVMANQELNHAYHLDAGLYAKYLRGVAEKFGAKRIEGTIEKVNVNAQNGFIDSLTLKSGQVVEGGLVYRLHWFPGIVNRANVACWLR